jgi:HEAT repeat protein
LLLGCLGGGRRQVLAQEGAAVAPAVSAEQGLGGTVAVNPAPGHESEAETLRKCLAEVRGADVAGRRRAVMILGKYRAPLAISAVIACLRDTDVEVRRSAAVAVSEWDVVPQSAQAEVVRLVGDPDVQVRRVASAMLPEIVGGRFGLGDVVILSGGEQPDGGGPRAPTGETAEVLNRALGDSDVTVRRNVLTAARYLPGALRQEALETALSDPDREVRLLAVQNFAQLRGNEPVRGEILARLAADADSMVRREAAGALARLGEAGYAGLERLAEDADAGVRARAVRELVQLQHPRGLELIERSMADEAIPLEERRGLLVYLGFYGERAKALLTRLTTDRSPLLRAEAIRGLSRLPGAAGGGPEFLVPCLTDESVDVRRTAAQGLLQWCSAQRAAAAAGVWPSGADLAQLQGSPYADVRLLAVRLTLVLPPEARLDALTEACLDDDTPVRCEAILRLASLGSPAALDVVGRSLEDPEPEVAMAAVRALAMRPSDQSRQLLQAYHDRCEDARVKALVASVLAEMGHGGAVQVRPLRSPVPPGAPVERIVPQKRRPLPRSPRAPAVPAPVVPPAVPAVPAP